MNTNPQTEREVYQTIPFTFEGQLVRVVFIDDLVWFVAQDICKILGWKSHMQKTSFDFQENEIQLCPILSCGKKAKHLVINLAGLNRILFGTRKPIAESINLWLMTKVLFNTTQIQMSQAIKQLIAENDLLIKLLTKDHQTIKKGKLTETEINIIKDLKTNGLSYRKISQLMGKNRETARLACKEAVDE